MNKKVIAMSLTAALAVSAAGMTALADDPIKVIVNGEALNIPADDTQPFIENERTLVPMRAIFEALGAYVNWDGETKTVISYDPVSDVSITMQIDSNIMFVGETPVELDVPAQIVNDRTVVPVRAIAEGMNSEVGWDGETRTVTVTKDITPKDKETEPAQIANPWTEYKTLDELNAAINENGTTKYQVADPTAVVVEPVEDGYRYLADSGLAEQLYLYTVGSSGEVIIRTIPGSADVETVSGYQQYDKAEEYKLDDGTEVTLYKYADTVFAVWEDDGLTHSAAVSAKDWDTTEVVKELVEDINTHFPKG